MATFFFRPRMEVTINGQRRKAFTVDTTLGATSPIAQGNAAVHPDEGDIAPGDDVRISLGYWNGSYGQVMSGEVEQDTIVYWPNALTFSIQGLLSRAGYAIGDDGEEAVIDEDTGEPVPLMEWIGVSDGEIVSDCLDLANVPHAELEEAGVLLGTVEPIALMPNQAPLDIIKAIDEALGYVTFDGPDGLVRRIKFSDVPSGTPAMILQQGINILAGDRARSAAEVYNRVLVTGVQNPDFTPSAKLQSPSAVSPTTGKPYIRNASGYRLLPYSSTILDTEDLCAAFAARVLGEKNRLRWDTSIALPYGSRALRPAQSCYIIAPKMRFDSGAIFWIDQVKHRADANSFMTDITLRGAYAAEGVNTNQKPVPAFTMIVKYEWTPDGGIWIIFCDASASTDPDGAFVIPATVNEEGQAVPEHAESGIATYEWDSTLGVEPHTSEDGKTATFVATSDPSGKTITLTVYDLQGRSDSLTRPIVIDADNPVQVRDLWAAVDSELLFTKDGERTWATIAIPAVFVVEMSAYDYTLALDASGTVYRVKVDLSFTTPASAPTNASSAYVRWIYPETKISGVRAWIGTANGQVWFSPDRGVTWNLVATLEGGDRITSIAESPFAENDIWLTAGGSIWHSYDGSTFEKTYTHPNAMLTATNHTAGFGHGFAAFKGTNVGDGAEASRIRERFGEIAGNWDAAGTAAALPAGTYKAAYTYRAMGGETLISPLATVVVAADQALQFPALTPLPPGSTGVGYYLSETPDSVTLRKHGEGLGSAPYLVTAVPDPGAAAPPSTNTTILDIANPSVAPACTHPAGVVGGADFPPQPSWITIGIDEPVLMALGTSPQSPDGASWYAQADAPFTFKRGVYHTASGLPQHTIRDGDVPGVAYAAAIGALLKTTSYYKSDCFPIYPLTGSRVGRMVGYGALHGLIAKGSLIWHGYGLVMGVGAATRYIYRLTETGFSRTPSPLEGYADNAGECPLIALANGALMTYAHNNHYPLGTDNCYRSTDGGITWALAGVPGVNQLRKGAGTTVYATSTDIATNIQSIWRSDDNGATWAQGWSYALDFYNSFRALAPHPTDPLTVIFKGRGQFQLSHDGGVTRTPFDFQVLDPADVGQGPYAVATPSGNAFVYQPYHVVPVVRRISPIATDTIPYNTAQMGEGDAPMMTKGAKTYFYRSSAVVSEDDGLTWSTILDDDRKPLGILTWGISGFVPGDATNDWYSLSRASFASHLWVRSADASPEDRWEDLTPQLFDTFPDGGLCYFEGAVRLTTG